MSENTPQLQDCALQMPASAPQVRVTVGLGSAGQKTWNLRRPVTLIGSRRPAHIVLHDRAISDAHCVIVNTGTEILLKDLHTNGGTFCANSKVDLTVLRDGDVITVGETKIQVAIHVSEDAPDDSGCGITYTDPTKFPTAVEVGLVHTDQRWNIGDAVVLVGRHPAAAVLLDHEDVSRRHALIFRFDNGPAIFDLGGRGGVWINSRQVSASPLLDRDRITIGPFGLRMGVLDAANTDVRTGGNMPAGDAPAECDRGSVPHIAGGSTSQTPTPGMAGPVPLPVAGASAVESELDALQRKIAGSWDRLNAWQSQLLADAGTLNRQENDLAAREAELDARDAALRGQLHDVTRYNEQLVERERAIAGELARLQTERDKVIAEQAALAKREAEVARRLEELPRREHVLAQRWGRLLAAACPHCGQPVGHIDAGQKDPLA